MQVSQPTVTAASPARAAGGPLARLAQPLAVLPQLPGIDVSAAVGDDTSSDRATQTRRMLDAERRRGTPSALAQFCDGTLQAERRVDPHSQAFKRQDALTAGRQDAGQARDAFRQALDDAAARRQLAARPSSASSSSPALAAAAEATDDPASETDDAPATDDAVSAEPAPAKAAAGSTGADAASQTPNAATATAAANPATAPSSAYAPGAIASAPVYSPLPAAATAVAAISGPSAISATTSSAAHADGSAPAASAASATGSRSAPGPAAPEGPRSADRFATLLRGTGQTTPDAAESKNDANAARLLRWVRTQDGKGGGTATMRLDPPELGKIRVQMEVHEGGVRLAIDTQTPLAHRLLSDDVETLRKSLEASGLQLERVEVRPPATTDGAAPSDGSLAFDARQDGGNASAHPGAEHSQTAADSAGQAISETPSPQEPDVGPGLVWSATESRVNIVA